MSQPLFQGQEPLNGHEEIEDPAELSTGPCSHVESYDSTSLEDPTGTIDRTVICPDCDALLEATAELWVAFDAVRSQWAQDPSYVTGAYQKRRALKRDWITKRANLANCKMNVEDTERRQEVIKNSRQAKQKTRVRFNPYENHRPEHTYKKLSTSKPSLRYDQSKPRRFPRKKDPRSEQTGHGRGDEKVREEQSHSTGRPWSDSDFDFSMGRAYLDLIGRLDDQHKRAKGRGWWGAAGVLRVDSVLKGGTDHVKSEPNSRPSPHEVGGAMPEPYRPASTHDASEVSIADDVSTWYDETRGGFFVNATHQSNSNCETGGFDEDLDNWI